MRALLATVCAVTVLAAAGCSTASAPTSTPSPTASLPTASTPAGTGAAAGEHQMGGPPFTSNGGATIGISAPIAIQPSAAATGLVPDGHTWSANITVVYTGPAASASDPFDPTFVQLSATADGTPCSQVHDGDQYRAPTVLLKPQQNVTWAFAFSCQANPGAPLVVKAGHRGSKSVYTFTGVLPG